MPTVLQGDSFAYLPEAPVGLCHRHAPRPATSLNPAAMYVALWPSVEEDDGCGEHEPVPASL